MTPRGKWLLISFGAFFGVTLIVLPIVLGTYQSPQKSEAGDNSEFSDFVSPKPMLIAGSIASALPAREDIGTVWKIDPIVKPDRFFPDTTRWEYSRYGESVIMQEFNKSDVGQVVEGNYHKVGEFQDTDVIVFLIQHTSIISASERYSNFLMSAEQRGGYSEILTSSIPAVCYGLFFDRNTSGEGSLIACYKDNVYIETTAISGYRLSGTEETAVDFAKITAKKLDLNPRQDSFEQTLGASTS